jgi:CheY-like chemotaxis protein
MPAKILIIDDSATSLLWHKLVLREGPYDLITATDGAAGVAAADVERPDLILMDATMPKMNGAEACRAIRAIPGLEQVPIIMAATPGEMKLVESVRSGCTDHVVKPVDRAELLAKVEGCLGARRSGAAA